MSGERKCELCRDKWTHRGSLCKRCRESEGIDRIACAIKGLSLRELLEMSDEIDADTFTVYSNVRFMELTGIWECGDCGYRAIVDADSADRLKGVLCAQCAPDWGAPRDHGDQPHVGVIKTIHDPDAS